MSRASRKAKHDVAKNLVVTEHIKKGRPLEKVLPLTGYKNTETLSRIKKEVMAAMNQETKSEMALYREDQLTRIAEKWDEIESDETMSGAEKHLAWSRWMKLEMDLRGTAAPSKSIVGHVNGPQLDALYLEIRQELLDADNDTKQDALLMVRQLVQSRKKPVVWGVPGLLKGNSDEYFS